MKKLITAALLSVCAAATTALAEEQPGGIVEGMLNGRPLSCQIWPEQSDFSDFGIMTTISLAAYRCGGVEGIDTLSLGFEKTGNNADDLEIQLRGQGLALYGGTATGATLELLSVSEYDGFLSLSGNVSARVGPRVGPSDGNGTPIDMTTAQELEISISGVIEALGH